MSHPPLKWAQDRNKVFITITVPDVKEVELVFGEQSFYFKGESHGTKYDYELELYGPIAAADRETKHSIYGHSIQIQLRKSDTTKWWPRLAKTENKLGNIEIDWDKWIEDEFGSDNENENPNDGSFELTNCADDDFTSSSDFEEEDGIIKHWIKDQ